MRLQNDTDGPSVDLKAVAVGSIEQDLRGNVIGSSTNGPTKWSGTSRMRRNRSVLFTFAWLFNQRSKTKVPHFDIHVSVEEEVAELEVSVDDLMGVHIVAGADDLDEEKTCFRLGIPLAAAEHVHHAAVVTELKGHVHIFIVFKALLKTDNIGMLKRAVELDLCVELDEGQRDVNFATTGRTLVLLFLLLSEDLATHLTAWRPPRASRTS